MGLREARACQRGVRVTTGGKHVVHQSYLINHTSSIIPFVNRLCFSGASLWTEI